MKDVSVNLLTYSKLARKFPELFLALHDEAATCDSTPKEFFFRGVTSATAEAVEKALAS